MSELLAILVSPEALAVYVALLTFVLGHIHANHPVLVSALTWVLTMLQSMVKKKPPAVMLALACLALCASGACAGEEHTCFVHRKLTAANGEAGTGTCVSCESGRSLVVTCAHVVPDGNYPLSVLYQGKSYPARFLAAGEFNTQMGRYWPDLALVAVEGELPVAEIAHDEPRIGARFRQWGFGGQRYGAGPSYKEGINLSATRPDGARFVGDDLHSTLPSESGDSGSGLFNDSDELCGVTWGGAAGGDPVYQHTGVPLPKVRAFIKAKAARLFPRLVKRMDEKRAKKNPSDNPKKPAPKADGKKDKKKGGCCCPNCECGKGKPCECDQPKKPAPKAEPKKPTAGHWKHIGYDHRGWLLYQWVPGSAPTSPGNCPGGNCPAPRGGFFGPR